MNFYLRLVERIKALFQSRVQMVIRLEDMPDFYKEKRLYLIGFDNPWLLIFHCPCGCQEKIHLNLLREDSPSWSFSIKKGKMNLKPSVRRIKGCRSHFWIRDGQIIWCYN